MAGCVNYGAFHELPLDELELRIQKFASTLHAGPPGPVRRANLIRNLAEARSALNEKKSWGAMSATQANNHADPADTSAVTEKSKLMATYDDHARKQRKLFERYADTVSRLNSLSVEGSRINPEEAESLEGLLQSFSLPTPSAVFASVQELSLKVDIKLHGPFAGKPESLKEALEEYERKSHGRRP